ncbi:MAG: SDR family NAD(P)-dependent oxidoreductase [Candidatus Omnitrophica bacterium]|nr:SDR family NAD(P)-dependent oxidoreductase [Candidatus Omnitrophota bacterium]
MKIAESFILITGAAKRLGREMALRLAQEEASLVLHYNRSKREAEELQEEVEGLGGRAYLVRADLSAGKGNLVPRLKQFVGEVYRKVPGVDVLINNASIFYPAPFGKIKESDWDKLMSVNLKAPFFLAQEIGLRMLKQRRGKIINLIDWTAMKPRKNYLPYAVSKAGLQAATIGLARTLAPHVQVLGIAPGPVLPPKGTNRKAAGEIISKTLLKRFGHPSDISETVRFLIAGTDFMTGAVIPVEGGASVF